MPDILVPVGTGSNWQNNELRYCLRSIEKYATGYDRIFIIGDDPGFLDLSAVKFFPVKDIRANKEARIAHKIFWAFQKTDIADEAILFNDDYILLKPVDLSELPYWHRESLAEAARRQGSEPYREALLLTHKLLTEAGLPTWHYDIHVPVILGRSEFIALEKWWQKSLFSKSGLTVKSIYANNVLREPGPQIADLKLRGPCKDIDAALEGRWVFSYCDCGLTAALKKWLVEKFPEPCQWEKDCGEAALECRAA